ncbi:hypothetical protein BGZ95_009354 [Linnemannia exigua]|uniref:BZIP domain-containing protein n=1 Tax=Linnemannia exigua TaxID=604196 RepID=A0AAD4DCX8_9FUNG|nr:hypothetical protein BGZ95_009354 [Linnemannia exigua]
MNGQLNQYPAATAAASYNQHVHYQHHQHNQHQQQHHHSQTQRIPVPRSSKRADGRDTDNHRNAPTTGDGESNEDDPEHLPDDDLIRWANAQFTVDYQPGIHSYEDELALKIAQSQRQQYHAQQQAALLHQQQQQLGGQFQPQDPSMHGCIDSASTQGPAPLDSRTGVSLVERSRQRNPLTQSQQRQQQAESSLNGHYDPRIQQPIYTQQQQQTYLIQQQQQHIQYPTGGFPSSLPSSLPSQVTAGIPQQGPQFQGHLTTSSDDPSATGISTTTTTTGNRGRVNSVSALSSLSLVSPSPNAHHASSSLGYFSHQEKLQQLESELEEYENELAEERRLQQQERASSSSSSSSSTASGPNNNNQFHQQQQLHQQQGGSTGYHLDQDLDDMMDEATFSATHSAVQSPQGDFIDDDDSDSQLHLQYTQSLDPEEAARQAAAAEEDKRRRNTAASARFRQKKRLREQVLEKTAKEMTAKSEILEARARELEMEIKWLRGLIVEKGSASVGLQGVGPNMLPGGVVIVPGGPGGGGGGGIGLLSSSLPNPGSFLVGSPESFAGSSKAATAARRPRKVPPPLAAKPPTN